MYKQKVREQDLDELFETILTLNNKEECYAFFEDLCTVAEIKSLAQRWQVALMLHNKARYNDVMKETGASSTTISRIKKCLDYGEGYAMALSKKEQKSLTRSGE